MKIKVLCLPVFLIWVLLVVSLPAYAFWGDDYLVKINEHAFTDKDYRDWWSEWREPGMAVHDTVDEFVDFMLLSQEAADMQLADNPGYQKKLDVFLRVRSLMQLKNEEVDARKVIPSHDELWSAYVEQYTPVLNLMMIAVQDEEQADVMEKFHAKGVAFEGLVEAAALGKIAEQMESTGPMRYKRFPEPLREVVVNLYPGDTAGPVKYGDSWYFMKVVERQDGTDEDFEKLKQNIIRDKLKAQEAELTQELIDRLKDEYKVKIDEGVIDRIGVDGPAVGEGDKIVLNIGGLEIPADYIYEAVTKTQQTRGVAKISPETFEESKNRIVNDYLVQTLTERAALDRHYEQVMPVKKVYMFYAKYRLVKEFEEQIVRPQVSVNNADIEQYYNENLQIFTQKGRVEYALVTTNETGLAKITEKKLKSGEDFFAIMQPLSPAGVKIEKSLPDQLPAAIKDVLLEMAPGQVKVVVAGDNTHFVKLIRRAEDQLASLDEVKDMIAKSLQSKFFNDLLDGYVDQLRERSNIKIDKSSWKALREQLLKENTL